MTADKFPWRLGKHQRAVVEHIVGLNRYFVSEAERFRKPLPDWSRGGAGVSVNQLATICRFEIWSEASNLLEGLADRGILARSPHNAMFTLSQDALRELGFVRVDRTGVKS